MSVGMGDHRILLLVFQLRGVCGLWHQYIAARRAVSLLHRLALGQQTINPLLTSGLLPLNPVESSIHTIILF